MYARNAAAWRAMRTAASARSCCLRHAGACGRSPARVCCGTTQFRRTLASGPGSFPPGHETLPHGAMPRAAGAAPENSQFFRSSNPAEEVAKLNLRNFGPSSFGGFANNMVRSPPSASGPDSNFGKMLSQSPAAQPPKTTTTGFGLGAPGVLPGGPQSPPQFNFDSFAPKFSSDHPPVGGAFASPPPPPPPPPQFSFDSFAPSPSGQLPQELYSRSAQPQQQPQQPVQQQWPSQPQQQYLNRQSPPSFGRWPPQSQPHQPQQQPQQWHSQPQQQQWTQPQQQQWPQPQQQQWPQQHQQQWPLPQQHQQPGSFGSNPAFGSQFMPPPPPPPLSQPSVSAPSLSRSLDLDALFASLHTDIPSQVSPEQQQQQRQEVSLQQQRQRAVHHTPSSYSENRIFISPAAVVTQDSHSKNVKSTLQALFSSDVLNHRYRFHQSSEHTPTDIFPSQAPPSAAAGPVFTDFYDQLRHALTSEAGGSGPDRRAGLTGPTFSDWLTQEDNVAADQAEPTDPAADQFLRSVRITGASTVDGQGGDLSGKQTGTSSKPWGLRLPDAPSFQNPVAQARTDKDNDVGMLDGLFKRKQVDHEDFSFNLELSHGPTSWSGESERSSIMRYKPVPIHSRTTFGTLAKALGVTYESLQEQALGFDGKIYKEASVLPLELSDILVCHYGRQPRVVADKTVQSIGLSEFDVLHQIASGDGPSRPPVVCVMGHVNHGKTTLLDTLRGQSNLAAKEVGGITQAVGAFTVIMDQEDVENPRRTTFLDTPGHASFSNVRRRGSSTLITDLVVLVVAADDGVQPQTMEAIQLCRESGMPMVVAINKVDMHPDTSRVRQQLAKIGVYCNGEGRPKEGAAGAAAASKARAGEVVSVASASRGIDAMTVELSALKKQGIDQLLETLELQAEIQELQAQTDCPAVAAVVDVRLSPGKGYILDLVVRYGTLRRGDWVVSGTEFGPVRNMYDDRSRSLDECGPSQTAAMIGIGDVRNLGSFVEMVGSEEAARELVRQRLESQELERTLRRQAVEDAEAATAPEADPDHQGPSATVVSGSNVDEVVDDHETGFFKIIKGHRTWVRPVALTVEERAARQRREDRTLRLILRAQVMMSLEVITNYAAMLYHPDMVIEIIKSEIGPISQADIHMASVWKAGSCVVVGFGSRTDAGSAEAAKCAGVPIITSDLVYDTMDKLKQHIESRLPPSLDLQPVGRAEVAAVFMVNDHKDPVAGCRVNWGQIIHSTKAGEVEQQTQDNEDGRQPKLWNDLDFLEYEIVVRRPRAGNEAEMKHFAHLNRSLLSQGHSETHFEVGRFPIDSLMHYKTKVNEVGNGMECGIRLKGFTNYRPKDVLECVRVRQIRQVLDDSLARQPAFGFQEAMQEADNATQREETILNFRSGVAGQMY